MNQRSKRAAKYLVEKEFLNSSIRISDKIAEIIWTIASLNLYVTKLMKFSYIEKYNNIIR